MEASKRQIEYYQTADEREPYTEWFDALRDREAQQRIDVQIGRVRLGNFGHCDTVGQGVMELKIHYGPGYRVYFGQLGNEIVLLLCGGDKSTQQTDIDTAHRYWADYRRQHG